MTMKMYKALTKLMLLVIVTATPLMARAEIPLERAGVPSLAPVVEMVKGAVVNVATSGEVPVQSNPMFDDPFFRRFFEMPEQQPNQMRPTQSLGSGVILDANKGYVVTNHHVVENATEIVIGLEDGREYDAKLIGSDPDSDIAVVQIDGDNLVDVRKGDSDNLRVGDFVMAIGSPFGLNQTVTTGIVSALGRNNLNIERIEDFIQTDASINPGNSGGALINLNGELVGINTAILSRSGGNVGIGFAIPINMVDSIVQQLVENGEVRRGLLGVSIQTVDERFKEAFGVTVSQGALVTGINKDSAAEKAGVELGDVITRVEDVIIKSSADLVRTIGLRSAGEEVELEIYRGKKVLRLSAVLDNRNASKQATAVPAGGDLGKLSSKLMGIEVAEQQGGVLITALDPQSQASQIGIEQGDVIIGINRIRVSKVSEMERVLEQTGDAQVLLTISRAGRRFFALLE